MKEMYQTKNGIPSCFMNDFLNFSAPTVMNQVEEKYVSESVATISFRSKLSLTRVNEGAQLYFGGVANDFLNLGRDFLGSEIGTAQRKTFDLLLQ